MSQGKSKQRSANIGASLLLVIFLVLCLFTFSAISLSTANNDMEAANRAADQKSAENRAANRAEAKLAQLNEELLASRKAAESDKRSKSKKNAELEKTAESDRAAKSSNTGKSGKSSKSDKKDETGKQSKVRKSDTDLTIDPASVRGFTVIIDEARELDVELALSDKENRLTITRWKVVPRGEWTGTQTLRIWTSNKE